MISNLAKSIDIENRYEILNYCKDCEFYEEMCTKKVAIRVCKKEKIKVKKEV